MTSTDTKKTDSHPTAGERLASVTSQIAAAARSVDRDPADVTLVAVSKTHDAGAIEPMIDAGQRVFGENRVQEAQSKWPDLKARYSDVSLHLIGSLQSNKAADAVALFDVIETVDRPKIARALASAMDVAGRHLPVYVQVNTGEEAQKGGVNPADAADLVSLCRDDLGLDVQGLMCIPPAEDEPSPHFVLLAEMAGRLGLPVVSMGMSGDFDVAIRMGATHVRVGTALFGPRNVR